MQKKTYTNHFEDALTRRLQRCSADAWPRYRRMLSDIRFKRFEKAAALLEVERIIERDAPIRRLERMAQELMRKEACR